MRFLPDKFLLATEPVGYASNPDFVQYWGKPMNMHEYEIDRFLRYFRKRTPASQDKKVRLLEFGFGTGDFIDCVRKRPDITIIGVDKDPRACEMIMKKCDVPTYVSLNDMLRQHGSNYFDIIFTAHTLEHIVDLRGTLAQLAQLLKPEGLLVVIVPCFSPLAKHIEHFYLRHVSSTLAYSLVQKGHLNYFTAKTLRRYLLESGFGQIREVPGIFGEEFLKKFGIRSPRIAKVMFRTQEVLQLPLKMIGGSFLLTTYATR